MPTPSPVFRRKQNNSSSGGGGGSSSNNNDNNSTSTRSSNSYPTAATHHNRNGNNKHQQTRRNSSISTVQNQKRSVWICVGTFFALVMLLHLLHLRIVVETQDMSRIIIVETQQHMSKEEEDEPNDHLVAPPPPRQQRRVRFIPYPHKTLGSGASVQCQWETRRVGGARRLDFTQRNAYTEGVCIPPTLNNTLHIFSSAEAIECLSSDVQNRDIRVILSGDSYMKHLFIGLADILLSTHISDDIEMKDSLIRSKVLTAAQELMDNRHRQSNSTFPFVQYRCEEECYGKKSLDRCSECIDQFSGNSRHGSHDDVWVVGFGIHTYNRVKHRIDVAVQNINQFLEAEEGKNRTIYVGPPYFFYREDFKDQSANMESVYRDLLPYLAAENPKHPFLDVFELTKSCVMKNCTFDGGHRTRYVNRWKAQLLLNTLCEIR
jgi:hypothetical protein